MSTSKTKGELYLAMNEDGDYEVGLTDEEAKDRLTDNIGGYCCRIFKVNFEANPPAYVEVDIDLKEGVDTPIEVSEATAA
jgi:hypothetical protein